MTDFTTLLYQVENGVAQITLNRPGAANCLNIPMAHELLQAAIVANGDPNVRAVVLTGSGKMFCAGGDLASFAGMGEKVSNGLREITAYLHSAIATFAAMDAPLITAINGTAAGAGFSLAIMGDFAITAQSAKFTLAYTGAGLSPDGSSTYYLPRLVGVRRARELMITNRVLSAEEAEQWGLVNQVVEDEEVLATATAQAARLAKGPTLAYGQIKKLLNASLQNSLESQMQMETEGIAGMAASNDGKEGIAAFLEKRKPEFKGN